MSSNSDSTDASGSLDAEQGRAGLYRLLGHLWLQEVDAPLYETLRLNAFAIHFPSLSRSDAESLDDLAAEYCRLFIGPKNHLPPYQSVWQTGQFQGEAATSTQKFIEVLKLDAGSIPMADHLGIQFQIMAEILDRLPEASKDEAAELKEIETRFIHTHLTWPQPLLEAATSQVQSSFYRELIDLTTALLVSEDSRFATPL